MKQLLEVPFSTKFWGVVIAMIVVFMGYSSWNFWLHIRPIIAERPLTLFEDVQRFFAAVGFFLVCIIVAAIVLTLDTTIPIFNRWLNSLEKNDK